MRSWRTQGIAQANDVPQQQSAPVIVWLVVFSTLMSNLTGETILGFQVSGIIGWFLPLIYALYALVRTAGRPRFPYWIWMPWIGLAIGYLMFADAENALQRTAILLTPIVIGMAVSKAVMGTPELLRIESILDKFSIAFLITILLHTGLVLTGAFPEVTGLSPQATTAALLGTFVAAKYALGKRGAALQWMLLAAVPAIALTRTAIVAVGLTLPLTFAPLSLRKRVVILIGVAVLGFLVFNSERIQRKMFFSEEGTIFDLSLDNPDLRTSGRGAILDAMEQELEESPWFGFGANASEQFVVDLTAGQLTHPHNDYLRLVFDYGYVGMFVFLGCAILQLLHALRAGYRGSGAARQFLVVGAGAFIPFLLLMGTDNIILYAAYFGNLHFMILGVGYAALANVDWLNSSGERKFE